jgi:lipoate-protein ligase A
MQQQQPIQHATVFTDIENELKNLSEDETTFITSSKEYQQISNKYQAEFSQFLISKFSNEYLQSGNTRTLEELLYVIRAQKDKYKDKFATDINEIRDQNKTLLDRNNELAESNQALQKELEKIKSRLWKDD